MRHARTPKAEAFKDSSRKRAWVRRRQRMEREALPLFAEQIAEQQPSTEAVMAQRAVEWTADDQRRRDETAQHWRRVRARFFTSYGPNLRAALRHAWSVAPYPATWAYLGDMLHSYDQGRLIFTEDGRLVSPNHLAWMRQGGAEAARKRLVEHMARTRAAQQEQHA